MPACLSRPSSELGGGYRQPMEPNQSKRAHLRLLDIAARQNESDRDAIRPTPAENQLLALAEKVFVDAAQSPDRTILMRIHAGVVQTQPECAASELTQPSFNDRQVVFGISDHVKSRPF